MTRKTVSISAPNDKWINAQLAKEEYASNSELINDLIRKARVQEEYDNYVRAKLHRAEKSGISTLSKEEMLAEFKANRANK